MGGFILTTVPKGQVPTESNTSVAPLLAYDAAAFLREFKSETIDIVGLVPLELLLAQVEMIKAFAAKEGVTLDVYPIQNRPVR